MSESGDWFLIPFEMKSETFRNDELEGKADYAKYVPDPEKIYIIEDYNDV